MPLSVDALQQLFATPVAIAVRPVDDYTASLHPLERVLLATMSPVRRRSFSSGRAVARDALAALNRHGVALLVGEEREPVWPEGINGSLSHCDDWCIAVASGSAECVGLGIDVERLQPLDAGVRRLVMSRAEQRQLALLNGRAQTNGLDQRLWDTVVFSIKESVFKCQFPLVRQWIDFAQVEITLLPDTAECGRFSVELAASVEVPEIAELSRFGRYLLTPTHVVSGCELRRR